MPIGSPKSSTSANCIKRGIIDMGSVVNVDVGGVVDGLFKGIDALFTSDEERMQAKLRLQVEMQKPHMMQALANIHEAQHPNWFVAGWRPAIGWMSGLALFYHWMIKDVILILLVQYAPDPDKLIPLLPTIDAGEITTLLLSLLGLGGLRTYEKLHDKARAK